MAKVKLTPRPSRQLPPIHGDPYRAWAKNLERVQATNAAALPENHCEWLSKRFTSHL